MTGSGRATAPVAATGSDVRVGPARAGIGELMRFALLAFGISWAIWGVALAGGPGASAAQVVGTFGPSLAAVLMIARTGGWPAVRGALRRLVRLRGAVGATVVAALFPIGLAATAVAIDRILGGATPIEWPPWWAVPVVVAYVLVLGGPLGEELGWRGHLLPRLETRMGPGAATLVVGVVWTVWHLPLFLIDGTVQTLIPLWMFALQIVVTSVVYTWLVHLRPDSLTPALAFHTSFNATVGLLLLQPPDAPVLRPLLIALPLGAVLAVCLARTPTFRGVVIPTPPSPLQEEAPRANHDLPTS